MFRGENKVTLDAKGRFAMPTRYRDAIQEDASGQLIVTIDYADTCLLIYALPDWEEIESKLSKLPALNPVARSVQRLMLGHATELELDAQGRILVPPNLREYAGLTRDVVLSGQGKRFELWDELQWVARRDQSVKDNRANATLPPELSTLSL